MNQSKMRITENIHIHIWLDLISQERTEQNGKKKKNAGLQKRIYPS